MGSKHGDFVYVRMDLVVKIFKGVNLRGVFVVTWVVLGFDFVILVFRRVINMKVIPSDIAHD